MSVVTVAPAQPLITGGARLEREARDERTRGVHTRDQESVSATLTVAAPAARVFAVLADPTAHAAIDGTGWVQEAVDRAPLTEAGQIFRMGMYHADHPDHDYQVVNKVEVLDPPRAIGWLTGEEKGDGHLEFGGWLWRYDLAPLGPSETGVTLTYDWSAVPQAIREYIQFPPFGPEHLTNSLHHLAELVAAAGR
ncbi:SRPBCC domain-containing protein [Nonomuraea terrae]|uniref:SRPBCC domain-containing protein n=1 Tax=Nonomuraea terrae TaxID=2530383 RepID=UPI001CB6FDF8|nr:SRPBCC family protein [Nonomuraea terrae]